MYGICFVMLYILSDYITPNTLREIISVQVYLSYYPKYLEGNKCSGLFELIFSCRFFYELKSCTGMYHL